MDIWILLIFISMLIYIFKFMLCKKIKIEATAEIENDLKKVKFKFKKNIGLAITYILLVVIFILVMNYYRSVSGDINNQQIFVVTLISASIILGPIYNLLKTIPDISDILVQNYGFIKKDKKRNSFYKEESLGGKIFFNYYVSDTFDFNKKFSFKLSNRNINTVFMYYLNEKSNRKSADINKDIQLLVDTYNSDYIPKYLRIEKCIYDVNKNSIIISIKNNCLLYTLYSNKVIAKLLILSLKEYEKIINEIIKKYI